MAGKNYDPDQVERAKRAAAGSLGKALASFACRFAAPVLIAPKPRRGVAADVNNGTITLIQADDRPVGVTCFHVIEEYRERRKTEHDLQFQVGNSMLDPIARLLWEDPTLDLAVLDLREFSIQESKISEEAGCEFFQPVRWPPMDLREGDWIAFGGYPGAFRVAATEVELSFDPYSVATSQVTVTERERIISQLQREYWIRSLGPTEAAELIDFGGMSGGPAFIHRRLYWEFVGIVYQKSNEFDLVYIRPAQLIEPLNQLLKSS